MEDFVEANASKKSKMAKAIKAKKDFDSAVRSYAVQSKKFSVLWKATDRVKFQFYSD